MIRFNCDGCGHGIQCDDRHAGKRAKCPKCAATVTVPGGAIVRQRPLEPIAVERVAPVPTPVPPQIVVVQAPAPASSHPLPAEPEPRRGFLRGRRERSPAAAPVMQQVVHVHVGGGYSNTTALVALLFGVVATATACLPFISMWAGGFGLLFAGLGLLLALLNRGAGFGRAIVGGVLSCVGLWPVFGLLGLFGTGAAVAVHHAATLPPPPVPAVEEPIDEDPLEAVMEPVDETLEPLGETIEPVDETVAVSHETTEEREPERPVIESPKLREQWRTWTSTGGHTLEARFSGLQDGNMVLLVKRDGSLARVPIEKLSAEDQALVRNEVGEVAEH